MGSPDCVQYSCKDGSAGAIPSAEGKHNCKSTNHLREVTPRSCDYDPKVPLSRGKTGESWNDYDLEVPLSRGQTGESCTGLLSEYNTSGLRDDAGAHVAERAPDHRVLSRAIPRSSIRDFLRAGAPSQHRARQEYSEQGGQVMPLSREHVITHIHAHKSKSQRAMHNHTNETNMHIVSREI